MKHALPSLLLGLLPTLAQAAPDDDAKRAAEVRAWVASSAKRWASVTSPHPRALLFLRLWARRDDPLLLAAAKSLAAESKGELRRLYRELAEGPARDLFAPLPKATVAALLEASRAGSLAERTQRYFAFLRLLNAKRGSPKTVLGRLAGRHGLHPWIRAQGAVVAGWPEYRRLRKQLRALPLGRLRRFVRVTHDGRDVEGWEVHRDPKAITIERHDLTRIRFPAAAPRTPCRWEAVAYAWLARSAPAARSPISTLLHDADATLLWAARADRLKRPLLAARLCAAAARARARDPRKRGALPALRHALAVRVWADAIAALGDDLPRARVAERLERITASLGGLDPDLDAKCAELVPLLRSMAEEDARLAKPGALDALSPAARRAYRLCDQGGSQTVYPGGVSTSGGARAEYVKLGWKAIPELLALLDDERPTRATGAWRPWALSSYHVLRCRRVAEGVLSEIIGQDLRDAIQPPGAEGGFRGPPAAVKAAAEAWWRRVAPLGSFRYLLDRLDHGPPRRRWSVARVLLKRHRRRAGPILVDRYRAALDPAERARWIATLSDATTLGPPLPGLEPLLLADLKHPRLAVVIAAARHFEARAQLGGRPDRRGAQALVAKLEQGTKGEEPETVGQALSVLGYGKRHPKLFALLLAISQERTDADEQLVEQLERAPDTPQVRKVLVALLDRPRQGSGVSSASSEGWSFNEIEPKDRAALILGRLLGEKTFLRGRRFREPAARDAAIAAFRRRHGV